MNFKADYYFFMILGIAKSDIPSIKNDNIKLNTFLKNLIIQNFNGSNNYIGIFHDNKAIYDINLQQLLESLSVTVIIHDLIKPEIVYNSSKIWIPKKAVQITNNNLMIIKDSEDLPALLKVAFSIPFFSARTNVLVILTGSVINGTESWIRRVFSDLWKIYILNVGLVFCNNDEINLFTYIPWTSPYEIKNLTEKGIAANIFYDKLKNLHRYPIKILRNMYDGRIIPVDENNSTIYLGVDGMTMSTILEYHNATSNMVETQLAKFFSSPCRFIHYNFTVRGLFGADVNNDSIDLCPFSLRLPSYLKKPSELDVTRHNIDVYFNARPLRFDMDYRVDTTHIQGYDSYCILVPAEHRIPQVFSLLMPLRGYVWLAVMLNFILSTMIYFGIENFKESKKQDFFNACFTLYRIQVLNISHGSKKLRASEKGYLLSWVLYCFLISAAYQSNLITFIIVPFYAPPIDLLHELKEMSFPIYAEPDILADTPNAMDKETSEILLEKAIPDLYTGKRSYDLNYGYLLLKSRAEYLLQRKDFLDKNGRALFHLMKECPMPLFTSYQIPRGSFLLNIIDDFIKRKKAAGLDSVWRADATRYLRNHPYLYQGDLQRTSEVTTQKENHVRLTTAHLQGAFLILFIGNSLALIAFLIEFCFRRIRKLFNL